MPRCSTCHRRLLDGAHCPAHREAALVDRGAEVEHPEPPAIPGYTLHQRLGAGGFAQVFAASRDRDGEPVALKIALFTKDWRFGREAEALRRVPTPHAPELIDFGEADSHPFIAMELVAGRSVANWLASQPAATPPRSEAINVLQSICQTVDAIHETGLIHRDLKPENLILSGEGITAIDFGLARDAGASSSETGGSLDLTSTGERLGTAAYMAPEQCLGELDLGFGVDVYATAVIAFELLCGRPPFVGSAAETQQAHVAGRPPPPSTLVELPAAVDDVFARGLAKSAGERPTSAEALFDELTKAFKETPTTAANKGAAVRTKSRSRRGSVALLAIDSEAPVERIQEAASLEDGELVRTLGTSYVIAFPRAVSLETGIRAAVNMAGRLDEIARRCVVHAAPLRIRESSRGVMAMGRALDRVESWTPRRGDAVGLLLTAEAAGELPDSCRKSGIERFYRWGSPRVGAASKERAAEISLRGRGPLFERLWADRRQSVSESVAVVSTIIGESGAGKSRILDDLAVELDGPRCLYLRAEERAIDQLLCFALGDVDLADKSSVREAARKLLGRDDEAIVEVLTTGGERSCRQSPGIRRQLLARTIGVGLSQRATEPITILLDDAHLADAVVLDGLEQASAVPNAALWVVATSGPELGALRPSWGERAMASSRHTLEALDLDAARDILLDLLTPAEFIPEAVVARLVELCEGRPLFLVEVAQLLRAEGRIRRLRGTESYYVDTDDLLRVSATPLAERLADRTLRTLPNSLVALAHVVSILERDISLDELKAVTRANRDLSELDLGTGMQQLVRVGLLEQTGDVYQFRSPLLCEAVRAKVPIEQRRLLHAAAASFFEGRETLSPQELESLARHAGQCGLRKRAAEIYLELGERSLARLDGVSAERHFTAALGQLDEERSGLRQRALAGRGQARLRSRKLAEGVEDFREAQSVAKSLGDTTALAEYLLDEATLLDWASDFAASESRVQHALSLTGAPTEPRLVARLAFAVGRSHCRAGRNEQAIENMSRAAKLARSNDDSETEVLALVLMSPLLGLSGRAEESEAAFERVIRKCEELGDVVHLGAAYGNRVVIWMSQGRYERGLEDLQNSRRCARIAGNPKIELAAEHNLAELLLWMGRLDEAADSAKRARELGERHWETPMLVSSLLPVRVACARGDMDEARRLLEKLHERFSDTDAAPTEKVLLEGVNLRCSEELDTRLWVAAIDEAADGSFTHASLEIAHLGISAMLEAGDREGARQLLDRADELEPPELWQKRFAELAARLDADQ